LNIGKKGLIAIVLFFLIIAVVLSFDLTRNALFNGLGMVSVTLQNFAVGTYTAITTNMLYLQWHILIHACFWISMTSIVLVMYYHGKLNKLSALVGKAAPTTPGYQNTLTSTIPMQQAPVQKVAVPAQPEVKKDGSTA
jgi:hypothetical protein